MDIEKFSKEVIDTYQEKARYQNRETARIEAVNQHAQAASQKGELHASNAARVARSSIETFREKMADGLDRPDAAKAAARETSERFDRRGHATPRHERERSAGLSL